MITCPHCQSKNINKNGKEANGKQNYLCRSCGKQFQIKYKNQGSNPIVKNYVEKTLCRNCGITNIKEIFNGGCHQLSNPYILNTLINYAESLEIQPQKQHYKTLQIDEFWTRRPRHMLALKKTKNGFYTLTALKTSGVRNQVVAYVFDDRSEKNN